MILLGPLSCRISTYLGRIHVVMSRSPSSVIGRLVGHVQITKALDFAANSPRTGSSREIHADVATAVNCTRWRGPYGPTCLSDGVAKTERLMERGGLLGRSSREGWSLVLDVPRSWWLPVGRGVESSWGLNICR